MNVKGSPKKAMRLLSLLLAVSLFLGTQGFTVFAQTISENGATAAGSGEQENEGKGGSSQTEPEAGNTETEEENAEAGSTYPQDSDNPDPQWEALPDSNVSENNARVGAGSPANPSLHKKG